MTAPSPKPRLLLVLLGLALAGWLVWWVAPDAASESEGGAVGVAAADAAPPAAAPAPGFVADASGADQAVAPRRDAVDEAAASAPDGPELLVRVVDADGGAPLPGAEVFFVDLQAVGPRTLQAAMDRSGELEDLFREHGVRRVADAHGEARFPRPDGSTFVLAGVAPGRFDVAWDFEPDADAVTLALGRRNGLSARVVDSADRPVPGAPVVLRRRWPGGWSDLLRQVSGEDGSVSFQLPSRLLEELDAAGGAEGTTFVVLDVVGGDPVEAEVDLDRIPDEPVRLVVPDDCGSVEVAVSLEGGGPPEEPVSVALTATGDGAASTRFGASTAHRLAEDGRATFPLVRVGLPLRVTARTFGGELRASVEGTGPAAPGATARFSLVLRQERPVLVGRVLNQEGRPAKGVRILIGTTVRDEHRRSSSQRSTRCDGEGRFRYVLEHAYEEGTTRTLRVLVPPRGGKPERDVSVDLSRPLPPGETDLGDLVVAPVPLVVAGRVLDPTGGPVAGSRVRCERPFSTAAGSGSEHWRSAGVPEALTTEDGSFTIRGRPEEAPRYRVRAEHPEYLEGVQEVPLGTRDVVVRLRPAVRLEGRLLLPEGFDPGDFRLLFLVPDPDGDTSERFLRLRDDGTFEQSGLPPGGGELLLTARFTGEELLRRPVPAGSGEPVVLDLRGMPLSRLVLHVHRADGRPLDHWTLAQVGGEGKPGRVAWVSESDVELVSARPAFDLVVFADGTREVRLEGAVGEREVELVPGYEIGLRVVPVVPLPDGWKLWFTTRFVGGDVRRSLGGFVLDDSGRGTAVVPAPGRYEVSLELRHTVRFDGGRNTTSDAVGVVGVLEVRDVAGRQEFTVTVDPERVNEVLEREQE